MLSEQFDGLFSPFGPLTLTVVHSKVLDRAGPFTDPDSFNAGEGVR